LRGAAGWPVEAALVGRQRLAAAPAQTVRDVDRRCFANPGGGGSLQRRFRPRRRSAGGL
jgi:hypothetical protein